MKKPASRLDDHNTALTSRQLIDHAGIEHEARALATQCLPAAHQAALATAETIVVELIEQRLSARAAYLDQEAQGIHEQITDLPDPRADRNLKHLAAHVLNETMKVFSANAPVIRQTIAAERNAKSEYNAWRDANALTHRQPVYPVSRVQHFALIVLLGMIEAAANAFMFLNATPDGLVGALACALFIAACNIGLAVFAGILPLRYLNLPTRSVHYWAWPTLVLATLLIVFTNIFAAHYRELASTATDTTDQIRVLSHIISHPFDLSLQSYALFVLGLLFAALAAFKGYTASDRYPGFEAQHRRWTDSLDDLNYLKTSIHGGLDAVREAEIVYVADKPLATRALIDAIRKRHTALIIKGAQARQLDGRDAAVATAAINRFRTLNLAIRTDGVTPAYFATPPRLSLLAGNGLEPAHALRDDAQLTTLVDAAATTHLEHTEKFLDLITELLKQIETAKDNTDKIMATIEKSFVDEAALPALSQLRDLIGQTRPAPASKGDDPCPPRLAISATRPTAVAS